MTAEEIISRSAYNCGDDGFVIITKNEYLRMLDRVYRDFAKETKLVRDKVSFLTESGTKEYLLYGEIEQYGLEVDEDPLKDIATNVDSTNGITIPFDTPYSSVVDVNGDYILGIRAFIGTAKVQCSVEKTPSYVKIIPVMDGTTVEYKIEPLTATSGKSPASIFGDNVLGFYRVEYNGVAAFERSKDVVRNAESTEGTSPVIVAFDYERQFMKMLILHTPAAEDEVTLYFYELPRIGTVSSYEFIPQFDVAYHDYLVLGVESLAYARMEILSVSKQKGLIPDQMKYFNAKSKESNAEFRLKALEVRRNVSGFRDDTTPLYQMVTGPAVFLDDDSTDESVVS